MAKSFILEQRDFLAINITVRGTKVERIGKNEKCFLSYFILLGERNSLVHRTGGTKLFQYPIPKGLKYDLKMN